MSNAVKKLETEVSSLSDSDLRSFRAWFQEFDAARWDDQFASDAKGGSWTDSPRKLSSTKAANANSSDPFCLAKIVGVL